MPFDYKRRWQLSRGPSSSAALKNWLLDRLESPAILARTEDRNRCSPTARLADKASGDREFLQVAALYRVAPTSPDFDVAALVAELVEGESVPFLPVLRYKPSGLRKREVWERTWDLQRQAGRRGGRGRHPGAAQVRHGGLPEDRLLAAAGQARRAQGALDQLPALLQTESDPQPGRRLGRVEPPPAGDGPGRLLRRPQAGGLGRQAADAAPGGARPTAAVDSPVAPRDRPGVRRDGGPVVPDPAGDTTPTNSA